MPYFKIPYHGYDVVEADSPEEAIEAYENDDTITGIKEREDPELLDCDTIDEAVAIVWG